jgi:hypothetical protein
MADRAAASSSDVDALAEALELIGAAQAEAIPLRLIGGLAVRVLCPSFPPRTRDRQDLDLASVSTARPNLTRFLTERGYEPDRRFNALYGHKQLFFSSPSGRAVDVLVDRVEMCHVLEFAGRIDRMPTTLDVTDLLLTKFQIVELNEKDARDVLQLLSAYQVVEGDEPGAVGLSRLREIVADDWGWWRTVTGNLDRIRDLATGSPELLPADPPHDPVAQLGVLARAAADAPKTLRWRIRAKVGDRKRWYRVPDEDSHD